MKRYPYVILIVRCSLLGKAVQAQDRSEGTETIMARGTA